MASVALETPSGALFFLVCCLENRGNTVRNVGWVRRKKQEEGGKQRALLCDYREKRYVKKEKKAGIKGTLV